MARIIPNSGGGGGAPSKGHHPRVKKPKHRKPKHKKCKKPKKPHTYHVHNAPAERGGTGQADRGNPAPTGAVSAAGPRLALEVEAATLGARVDGGLLDAVMTLAGSGDLSGAALATWQREQDRLANRAWRRPGGLARMGGLYDGALCWSWRARRCGLTRPPGSAVSPQVVGAWPRHRRAGVLDGRAGRVRRSRVLSCGRRTHASRVQRLAPFSKIALMDGPVACFLGEWADPALTLDGAAGEYIALTALGAGAALRDDPDDVAYPTATTAQAIIAAEFARRAAWLPLDQDQSAVLPSQPTATFTPVYDGFNLEEILHDLMGALGDYTWTVYDHPRNRDAAGFPTWRLAAHPRDTATTSYIATGEDIASWRIAPSTERAYNVVQVAYVDAQSGPGVVTVSDPRLNGDGSQGTAPFRRRKLRRSLGSLPLTHTQATAIANAWLAAYPADKQGRDDAARRA